jgi:hypothetical protein
VTDRGKRTAAAACALASACVVVGWMAIGVRLDSGASASVVSPQLTIALRQLLPAVDHFNAIAARPLFSPGRAPRVVEQKAMQVYVTAVPLRTPPVPLGATLLAVAMGPGRRVAVLRLESGKTRVILEGEGVEGWTLAQVTRDHVLLHNEARTVVLAFASRADGLSVTPSPIRASGNSILRRR